VTIRPAAVCFENKESGRAYLIRTQAKIRENQAYPLKI
jgi:hypothetical protein